MNTFMNAIENTLNNVSYTENGAAGYATTGQALLDLNFSIPQLRTMSDDEIFARFVQAFNADPKLAMRWLFYLRDIRGGVGERKSFCAILRKLGSQRPELVERLINATVETDGTAESLIPFYGRWDDMLSLTSTSLFSKVCKLFKSQLETDESNMGKSASCSLLAKWMPSVNASNADTVKTAKRICKEFGVKEKYYRKLLSKLRGYIDVIEKKASKNLWEFVNYEHVPSQANLKYARAFMKHDEERRRQYIEALTKGEKKINSSTSFPHDILNSAIYDGSEENQKVYQAMWDSLENKVDPSSRTIVVADGSGSMTTGIPGANVQALTVANALAIYFAERLEGEFHNKYITFSMHPQFVDLGNSDGTLIGKYNYACQFDEVANTNIEAVFDLILDTAIRNKLPQEQLPTNILIISDMEFDSCAMVNGCNEWGYGETGVAKMREDKLFDVIKAKYEEHGYKIPRLIFWNVNSRTGTIPVISNDLGVALVSGYSIHIANMVMSGELDPYKCLVNQLMNERYNPVIAALGGE